MSKQSIFIFTGANLDGAGCVWILNQLFSGSSITHKVTSETSLKEDINAFIKHHIDKYDKVFLCNISRTDEILRLLDNNKVTAFERSEICSCTELIYRYFSSQASKSLTDNQKILVKLISDFDSYQLKTKTSYDLNTLFYSMSGDRVAQFCKEFSQGYTGFSLIHKATLKYHTLRVKDIIDNLECYSTTITKKYKVVCCFSDYGVNDIADFLFKDCGADIAIIVNAPMKRVSFRANKTCDYDVSKLAVKLCDGGGREKTAAGKLTDKFLRFSSLFKQHEN